VDEIKRNDELFNCYDPTRTMLNKLAKLIKRFGANILFNFVNLLSHNVYDK
jgi:hypothetical protein